MPTMAVLLWLVAATLLLVAMVAQRAIDQARAQAAADAAVLAEAAQIGSATGVAAANGATVVDGARSGSAVYVATAVGDMVAEAQASVPRPEWSGLTPALQEALVRAEAALGRSIPIVSGYRSSADQQRLWDARATNPYPVAAPGTSAHERGLAVDVPLEVAGPLARIGLAAGLCQPLPVLDPVHFVLCRTTPTR